MKTLSKYIWSFLCLIALILGVVGFFYFETSILLRILVIILGLIGLLTVRNTSEILVLLTLYLGLYDLYNIRYGLALPLSVIILVVFGLTLLCFSLWYHFQKHPPYLDKNILLLYLVIIGLVVMELFLTMSFWPVDPKIKGLVIVVIFYIISRVFYLYINNVLNLKKTIIFVFVCLLILGVVLSFNMFYGF